MCSKRIFPPFPSLTPSSCVGWEASNKFGAAKRRFLEGKIYKAKKVFFPIKNNKKPVNSLVFSLSLVC